MVIFFIFLRCGDVFIHIFSCFGCFFLCLILFVFFNVFLFYCFLIFQHVFDFVNTFALW